MVKPEAVSTGGSHQIAATGQWSLAPAIRGSLRRCFWASALGNSGTKLGRPALAPKLWGLAPVSQSVPLRRKHELRISPLRVTSVLQFCSSITRGPAQRGRCGNHVEAPVDGVGYCTFCLRFVA